jgi:hypothetical protein
MIQATFMAVPRATIRMRTESPAMATAPTAYVIDGPKVQ